VTKSPKKERRGRNSLDSLYRKRDKALERVVSIWVKSEPSKEDPDELNRALDVLAVAHAMVTFEFASGSFKS
jgi:hypothetical protein